MLQLREGGKYKVDEQWEHDVRFMPDGTALRAIPGGHWTQTQYEDELQANGKRRVDKVSFESGPVTAELKLDSPTFTVSAEAKHEFHGFIHPASDRRHFQYDDGSFYYPIGPCLRSPSDTRLPYLDAKWNVENIARIGRRGTYQYDDYLAKFGEAGINWARVWMCSWWCALEWRRDWHGYQGLGRYNLLNAWRLDYILKKCEENGIRVDLGLINHGQFTQDIDTEWNNNPYNAALGGPLNAASEFFTDKAAKIAHQNRLRYVVARYAHSPSIFAWSLCSEMEFTEEYERHVKWNRTDEPAPNIEHWVEEMADFLKATDPYHHMVTTHFSHPERGEGTLKQPSVDFATSNAYSAFDEIHRPDGAFDASYALGFLERQRTPQGISHFQQARAGGRTGPALDGRRHAQRAGAGEQFARGTGRRPARRTVGLNGPTAGRSHRILVVAACSFRQPLRRLQGAGEIHGRRRHATVEKGKARWSRSRARTSRLPADNFYAGAR